MQRKLILSVMAGMLIVSCNTGSQQNSEVDTVKTIEVSPKDEGFDSGNTDEGGECGVLPGPICKQGLYCNEELHQCVRDNGNTDEGGECGLLPGPICKQGLFCDMNLFKCVKK